MKLRSLTIALTCAIFVGACGNTVYGPRRLIAAGYIDDGSAQVACPATAEADTSADAVHLSKRFFDLACGSLRAPRDTAMAREMMDHGITLNRMRCNDFFAERAGHQTRQRIIRGTVSPISALITGVIGISDFSTDADRQEAIQILGIGQSATVAGLDLYESEFLFASDNINSVRTLVMRALDDHGARILDQNVGFYGGARHLIDHQMICTPANILELTQTAIREGRVRQSDYADGPEAAALGGENDRAVIEALSASLRTADLTPDQVGALWWLSELVEQGGTVDQKTLAVIQDRLKGLRVSPIAGVAGSLVPDRGLVTAYRPMIEALSPPARTGFEVTRHLIVAEMAKADPPALLDRTRPVAFDLPPQSVPRTSRAQEVSIAPVSSS